jgi:hypothetical protein
VGLGETGPSDDQYGKSRVTGDCYGRILRESRARFPRATRPLESKPLAARNFNQQRCGAPAILTHAQQVLPARVRERARAAGGADTVGWPNGIAHALR